ncbi:MAG TPA: carboxypeptidase-like regulatory domain-containing protein, partial [Flavitalea sp.]|nr:carboxypeptidase-like regulatory domain-containing protein [Flavitalea sp.]
MSFNIEILAGTSGTYQTGDQAETEIRGIVTDNQMKPIAGASVAVKNRTGGTVTDSLGNFKITVPNGNESLVI